MPKLCDVCCSPSVECQTDTRREAAWQNVWTCQDCGASVGCHPNSREPMGLMADKATRTMRVRLHAAFDPIWKSGLKSREGAYTWLASALGIERDHCHISQLDLATMKRALPIVKTYLAEREEVTIRRKDKKIKQARKRYGLERSRIERRKFRD